MSKETREIIKREFRRITERKSLYLLMILLPIAVSILYAFIYKGEIVRDLPVAILDRDHSSLSRTVTEFVEASGSMKIAGYVTSVEEIKAGIQSGKFQGAFAIPHNFENDVKSGKNSTIVIYKNTANLIVGNLLMRDGMTIVKTVSAGALIKKLRNKGMLYDQAMAVANPVKIEAQSLYNPNYSYLGYLVPGLLAFTLQLVIMISSVIVISSEFTHETFGELLKISGNNIYKILAGKSIPHLMIHISTILFITGIILPLCNIKSAGSIIFMIFFFILFAAACLAFGLFISAAFHDQLFATNLALFINMPAFIFSGYTFPVWAMPAIQRIFAAILPFTHFVSGYFKIYNMDAPVGYVMDETLILFLFTAVGFILTIAALKIHIKKYYKISV